MTLINFVILMVIKPLILSSIGLWLDKAHARNSAGYRNDLINIVLCALLLLVPLSFFSSLIIPRIPLWIDPQSLLLAPSHFDSLISSFNPWIIIYSIGVFWCLFRLFIGLSELMRIKEESESHPRLSEALLNIAQKINAEKPASIHISRRVHSPVMFGFRKICLYLPTEAMNWSDGKLGLVIMHELSHGVRNDWFRKIAGYIVCSLYWFIPPVWWLYREMENTSERATDNHMAHFDIDSIAYAKLLKDELSATIGHRSIAYKQLIGGSECYQRILSNIDNSIDKNRTSKGDFFLGLFIVLLFSVPLITVNFSINSTPSQSSRFSYSILPDYQPSNSVPDEKNFVLNESDRLLKNKETYLSVHRNPETDNLEPSIERHTSPFNHLLPEQQPSKIINKEINSPVLIATKPSLTVMPNLSDSRSLRSERGWIRLNYSIDENGRPSKITIIESNLTSAQQQSAIAALKQSKFIPAISNNQPIEVKGIIQDYYFSQSSHLIRGSPRVISKLHL